MANGRIVTRAEYEAACQWWEEKKVELADPLLTDEQRQKLLKTMDFVHAEIERYIVGVEASRDPEARRLAFKQGVTFYECDEAGNVRGVAKMEEPKKEPQQTKPAAATLASWLDDD
ncbi:hypothetical protein [Paenibacillus ginsengihumi]|uniref:hypothetical protein n=1 Tax=Paenibacillus ginsengihumi TaxID=431596 RepID=UPI00037CD856|nr:hypothetical protein [Paenibacillus ginsengihumi]